MQAAAGVDLTRLARSAFFGFVTDMTNFTVEKSLSGDRRARHRPCRCAPLRAGHGNQSSVGIRESVLNCPCRRAQVSMNVTHRSLSKVGSLGRGKVVF
jgi:hypothetical protein